MDYATQFLGKSVTIKIDRPLGTKHPKHSFYYSLNYGHIDGIKAPDGKGVDAYILGVFEPVQEFTGKCVAVIHRINDEDDKLIVTPEDLNYSDEQTKALTEFQERFFKSIIIRESS